MDVVIVIVVSTLGIFDYDFDYDNDNDNDNDYGDDGSRSRKFGSDALVVRHDPQQGAVGLVG